MIIRRHTAPRPAGHTFETQDGGKVIEHDTHQCSHCGKHWQRIYMSGRVRGKCPRCQGVLCNEKPQCQRPCTKEEQDDDNGTLIIIP